MEKSSAKLLPKGTILLSTRATIGECSITKTDCTTNQGFQSLIPAENTTSDFCYYLIQTKKKEMITKASGSTFLEISNSEIKQIGIKIPQISEQEHIAKFFSLLDQRIEKQRQLVEALKLYKRGVIEAIFDQKIKLNAKEQVPFSEWKSVSFGSLIEEVSDRTQVENEDTLLSVAIEGMFLNTELFDHQRGSSNIGYKKIERGMLILSTQNLHLGNANVNLRFEHGIVSPAYKTYQITGCIPEFLNLWIKRDSTKQFFYNATTVGASVCRRNVEWQTLYEQTLLLPSRREQEIIISLIAPIQKMLDAQILVVLKLAELKQELLRELFI